MLAWLSYTQYSYFLISSSISHTKEETNSFPPSLFHLFLPHPPPYHGTPIINNTTVSMECRDRGIIPGQEVVTVYTGVHGGLTSFQSMETLMMNMTTGGQQSSTNTPNMERKNPHARKGRVVRRSTSFGLVDGMLRNETPHLPPKQNKGPRSGLNQRFGSVDVLGNNNNMLQKNRNVHGRTAGSNPQRVSNKEDDYGFANMPPAPPQRHLASEVSSVSDQSHYGKTESISPNLVPRKCASLTNIQDAGKSRNPNRPKSGGLFASKRFGSATELFNKLVKKKSPSQTGLNEGVNHPRKSTSRDHVTGNHQIISPGLAPPPSYPVFTSSPIEPGAVQGFQSSTQNTTPDLQHHPHRISPAYPPPLRATLSYSEISTHQSSTTPPTQSSITPTGMPSAIMGSMHYRRSTSDIPTSTPYENLEPLSHNRLQRHESIASISSKSSSLLWNRHKNFFLHMGY